MDETRKQRDDERRRRRDDEEKKQRMLLMLLGFACLIQLFISLQGSREVAASWQRSVEDEARAFDKKVRDEGGGAAVQGAAP